ncbi:leucyl aminopeptidase [Lacihabitans sp. CCS-44]|uniref:leucyl aminopeptidase family protein n=1 Tax=Lacihabitans sp. CCS-44 TaxID=2487331 RepID=UPI0020CF2EA2|nr:leucyl aminopeptidase [Lacihabitans sp. CCS-44]MCP9754898.1 leucyl aminopeptidase [Lacihabitans sp. CCS-44]
MISTKLNSTTNSNSYIIPVFENENIPDLIKKIGSSIKFDNWTLLDHFKGSAKETLLSVGENKIYFLGLGKKREVSAVSKVFRSFFYNNKSKLSGNINILLDHDDLGEFAEAIANGIYLAQYNLGMLKTNQKVENDWFSEDAELNFVSEKTIEKDLAKGKMLAETQMKIMKLVDSPANYKTPQMLSEEIEKMGKASGFSVKIYDEKQCEEIGLKALLAVSKGSVENPARFVIMEYSHPESNKKVGLIGKGVTFDTGGVSLKPGDNMNYMKSDMGGAAAVIGTLDMAAKLGLKVNIVGAVALTENCIDSLAIKPGDVIGSYLGKTIEVINTDAEGRLVLADALAYVTKNHQPDAVIDLATLTGNCIQALGYAAAALLSNNDDLAQSLMNSGQTTGEKVWRMPLWDDYKDMMKSDVADIKNLSSAPIAGAITAAKFLEEFIDGHTNWAHLDIAGVAFGDSEYGSMKSSTGYGVKLLVNWLEENIQ